MKNIIVATANKGKIKEIKQILKDLPFNVVSMADVGIDIDIEETGSSFEENALIKARAVSELTGEITMADDSGLEVDYLDGAPGIYSSRFAGENATDEQRVQKLLNLLENVPLENRTARFVCAAVMLFPDGEQITTRGTCEGYIGFEPKGNNGFGYDPVFYFNQTASTIAEMPDERKNEISHRAVALSKLVESLKQKKGI